MMSFENKDSSISATPLLRTLLLTDLVDSTKLVETLGDKKAHKVAVQHERLARDLLSSHGGREIDKTDGFLLLFERPIDAVGYALAYHRQLIALSGEVGVEMAARIGLHLGEIFLREIPSQDVARGAKPFEVDGLAKPMAARVMSLAQGRQTLLTRGAYDLARRATAGRDLGEVRWTSHGHYFFKGVTEPVEILEVGAVGFAPLVAPPDSEKARREPARPSMKPSGEPRWKLPKPPRNPFYHRQGITDPCHFFGRADMVRSLLEMMASGQSCALVGERRIGKSSLLTYLSNPQVQTAHGLEPERTLTPVLDFLALHASSPEELWTEILEALELAAPDTETEELLAAASMSHEVTFAVLRRTLRRLKRRGLRVVLLCDEFELAVQNPQFDQGFFGALRSLAGNEGVVFVTASRFNLLELEQYRSEELRKKVLGSPFFNIFAEFRVGPFESHEVAELLAVSLEPTRLRLEPEDVEWLDRVAGRHPYFLQLAAYHLYEMLDRIRRGSGTDVGMELKAVHDRAREEVRREAAKIFRNQWQHSTEDERRVLMDLASEHAPPTQAPRGGADTIARLERRGLVRRAAGNGSCRLFSDLFQEWIFSSVTSSFPSVADGASPPALPERQEVAAAERYEILEEVGRGGSGTVYKAWDERLERVVAVKVLDEDLRSSRQHLDRLLAEARTCARLGHPHIVVIHDIDVDNGILVQEFLAGGSLRDLLTEVSILAAADVRALAVQLARALGAAHEAGVVHRDLKPENVLLTARAPVHRMDPEDAERPSLLPPVKLGDFGAALRLDDLSQTSERRSVAGTLAYMAPEQMLGEGVGPPADFFGLGMMLYEARQGKRVPPARAEGAARFSVREGSSEAGLDGAIARCLARDPKDRFRDAGELLAALLDGG